MTEIIAMAVAAPLGLVLSEYASNRLKGLIQPTGRISDYTSFFLVNEEREEYLVEYGITNDLFLNPKNIRTEE